MIAQSGIAIKPFGVVEGIVRRALCTMKGRIGEQEKRGVVYI